MLQRIASRSRRSLVAASPCSICTCRCGATLLSNNDSRRAYAWMTRRKAPSTYDRERKARGVKDDEWRPENTRMFTPLSAIVAELYVAGHMEATPDNATGFLVEFHDAVAFGTRFSMEPAELRQMFEKYQMSEGDCLACVRLVGHQARGAQFMKTLRKLLLSLSRAGSVEATIMQVGSTFARLKNKEALRKTLESSHMKESRALLSKVAKEGKNHRAMVLEGKLARFLGNEERAIEIWTRAVKPALAAQEVRTATGETSIADPLELSSPWIELMAIHHERSHVLRGGSAKAELSQCQWAIDIGCKHDDPMAHYWASTYKKSWDRDGRHSPTSDWLYHITKAAASGHKRACHELGVFYAEGGWKYIEDEPPDRAKPTPFDSYPIPLPTSLWARVRNLLSLSEPIHPKDAMFHIAVFPHTAAQRYHLAAAWLEEAMRYFYAPSFLLFAEMLMREHLWDQADAPSSAVELSSKRYSYASKSDFEAGSSTAEEEMPSEVPEIEGPPNPLYNLERAKANLREVFYCHEAHLRARKLKGQSDDVDDEDEILSERNLADWPLRLRKWFRFPEVRESYEDDLENLFLQAKAICDERGWDLYDEHDALVYKAEALQQREASFG